MDVEIRNVQKHFGLVHANDDICMQISSGTIQGILGENGAGKSTLMKILSGFYQADGGEILLNGKPVIINTPADAIKHGIGMLHQDPLDFPPMKVLDNLIIGQSGNLLPKRKQVREEFNQLQNQFGFHIDPDNYVDMLTVGERQQLEILRLLWLGAQVLILDEPTTGISALQKVKLFETLRILASQGKTVIFVSHKLEDVEDLCHQVDVFRQGKNVGRRTPQYSTNDLVQLMFGKAVELAPKVNATSCDILVSLKNLSMEDNRLHISKVNLDICRGEVIGLAGMEGSGQRIFLQACGGLRRSVGGKIIIGGKDFTGKPYHYFLKSHISYVPASRLEEGLIPGLSITDHIILADKPEGFLIDQEKAVTKTKERIQDFAIRGKPDTRIEALSGGNQQRALLALLRTPLDLLLLEHPTRGLDIESTMWIWAKLKERCKCGTTIIFISSDLEEIMHYSDRILVFFGGKVSKPINATETNVHQLGELIGGKGWEGKEN